MQKSTHCRLPGSHGRRSGTGNGLPKLGAGAGGGAWRFQSPDGLLTGSRRGYSGGLVLRRPVTRSPSFHWARDLRMATRSKRFRTLRFPPVEAAARRLRCWDIKLVVIALLQIREDSLPAVQRSGVVTRASKRCQWFFEAEAGSFDPPAWRRRTFWAEKREKAPHWNG